jgi:curved DNA-binding protein CbpA
MDKLHTHYDNLKVTRNAPVEVIRAAYRAMAQKYHPDINSSPAANNTMRLLNEAWEVLSDPLKRTAHDKWILEEEEKQKKKTSFNATNVKEQVFEDGNFKFHFQTPSKGHETFRKNQKPKGYYDKFTAQKKHASPLVLLNTWLGRKNTQIKTIALVVAVFCGGLLWISVESHRTKKAIVEINARSATSVNEKPKNLQLAEEKPLRFVPLSEFPEKIVNKKEKVSDFSSFGTPVQSESKKAVDPERQERTGYAKGAYQQASAGLSNFTVDNQRGGGDALARIYLNGAKPASRSMYVKAGEKFTARGLPPGSYVFRYRFIGNTKTYEADRLFPLEETTTTEGTRFSNVTVTLFTVSDGNLQTKEVPEDKF